MNDGMDSLARSIHKRLVTRAKSANLDVNHLRIQYAIERFLYRLSVSPYRDRFILKGATLYRVWGRGEMRPTRDVDFLGYGEITTETIPDILQEICSIETVPDGLSFDSDLVDVQTIRNQEVYGGIRAELTARLGHIPVRVPIDVGVGDALHTGPEEIRYPVILDEMPTPILRAYPKHTFLAEKVETLVRRGLANSRMKDIFDIYLFREQPVDGSTLVAALRATFERRGTTLPNGTPAALTAAFYDDPQTIATWKNFRERIGQSSIEDTSLCEVIEGIREFLQPAFDALIQGSSFHCNWDPERGWIDERDSSVHSPGPGVITPDR